MLISTKSHGEKIFHTESCTYAKRIKPENMVFFYTVNEAYRKGRRACNCCSFMGQRYKKEEDSIRKFANRNGMKIWLYDDAVYVENVFTAWKITRFSRTEHICLLHANREKLYRLKHEKGRILYNYHLQNDVKCDSIREYLQYIKNHDDWRNSQLDDYKKMPRETSNQRKMYKRARKISKRKAANNVLNILDRLQVEREYKETCCNG